MNYTGYLRIYEVITPQHKTIYTNGFTKEEAYERVIAFIKKTPLYNKMGDRCLEGIEVKSHSNYPFTLLEIND